MGISLLIVATPSFAVDSNEKDLFIVAQRAFEDGFYDVSLRYVNQLLTEFPQTTKVVEARLLEGQSYFFKQQYVQAFNVFKDLVALPEYKDASLFWLGETYFKGGDIPKAQEKYRQVIDAFPASLYAPQAYYSLAWSYFQKEDYVSAKKIFQALIDKFPANNLSDDAAFKLGECDYNAVQYEAAIVAFNNYISGHPGSTRLYEAQFNVAEALYNLEQYDKASDAYQKARSLTTAPSSMAASLIGTGWCQIKLKKYVEALKTFDEAQFAVKAAKVSEEDVLLAKASLFIAQEKYVEAASIYSEVIARFPASLKIADTYLGRANAWYLVNDYVAAIKDYEMIIAISSGAAGRDKMIEKARFGLAWTYSKSGDIDKAVAMFQLVADKSDNKIIKVSAYSQIADAYQEAGVMDKAIDVYDKILHEMPDTPYEDHVQYYLGIALLKSGKIDAAVLALQALKANYPGSKYISESRYYLGLAYFRRKEWATAVEILTSFISDPVVPVQFVAEARYVLAMTHFNLKQFDRAIVIFNDVLRLYPDEQQILQNAYVGLAKTYDAMGDTKEALARFKDIVHRYPHTEAEIECVLWLGQYNMTEGLYQVAVELYTKGLFDLPETVKQGLLCFELGRAYLSLENFEKALAYFRQVDPQIDPLLYPKAKIAIAGIFVKELDTDKAVETYHGIIATSPQYKRDALMKIAQIYRREKKFNEELFVYAEAIEADKGESQVTSAGIQFSVGDVYEVLNESDKALEAYFKIPYIYSKEIPWVIKAYLRIARIFENNNELEKAITAYRKVVDLKVDESKFANERIELIQERSGKK